MNLGYLQFIKNAFQANLAYRMNVVIRVASQFIFMFIQISIWKALYSGSTEAQTREGAVGLGEMITYVIISASMSIVIGTDVIGKMERKVRSGEIAMDLIKPLNLKGMFLCEMVGNNGFKMIFQLIPLLVAGSLTFGIHIPGMVHFVFFVITLLHAAILFYLMSYIVALLAFWYMSIWHLERFLGDFIALLSGSVIPLWFFPEVLQDLSAYLPFKLIYYTPLSIYLERVTLLEIYGLILQQWGWIIVLYMVERFVWRHAVNKVVVQGG